MCVYVYRKYIGQVYTDSLVHDEAALDYLVNTVGIDKVLLGSDYPFPLGEHHPGKLVEGMLTWDAETKVEREGVIVLLFIVFFCLG